MMRRVKKEKISLFVQREIFIATITTASVIVSIMFFVVTLSTAQTVAIYLFDLAVTGILIYDFCDRLRKSKNHRKFLLQHFYEIPALLPLVFFSFIEYESTIAAIFRSLRIIRGFRILRLLRLLRLINLFKTANYLKASGFVYLVVLLVVSTIFGSIGMLVVEEGNPESTIKNFGDAVWFAMTTMTISGFGDVYPVTFEGRIISAILIFVGLTTILGFISSLGTTIVEKRLSSRAIAHDIKKSIKDRIDILEKIHTPEVETLIDEIKTLHRKIYNRGNVACTRCGFVYPEESLYCNKCGKKVESISNRD